MVVLRARPSRRSCTVDAVGRVVAPANLYRLARPFSPRLVSMGAGFLFRFTKQTPGICAAAVACRGGSVRHCAGCNPSSMDCSGHLRATCLFVSGRRRRSACCADHWDSAGGHSVPLGTAPTGNRTRHLGCCVGIAEPPRRRHNAGERRRGDRDHAFHLDFIPGAGPNGVGATGLAQEQQ
jgi:hypothetical protein